MPISLSVNFPFDVVAEEQKSYAMILDDYFVIENIEQGETIAISVQSNKMPMRPIPVRPNGTVTKVDYVAVNVCDQDLFRVFYLSVLGKSIKMYFEGYLYRGYLSDAVYGDEDISFSFTYSSKLIVDPIDDFLGPRR